MECPACTTENPKGAKFCLDCGANLILSCAECGTELPPGAKFCFECGAQVFDTTADSKVGKTSDTLTESLQRLVPQAYAERLREASGKLGHERRLVTILFSDVKGSTAMAEELDPEDVMEIMNEVFPVLIEPVYKYEGTLARLMGDAVLALFGAPISHEDDPERAIHAGLEIVAGAQEYAARLKEERGIEGFDVRVGINTGLVVVGEVGSDLRVEYTAMGDAINLAARMEQNAPPGGVLITHDTYRHVRGVFDLEPQAPLTVKGVIEPVSTYLVSRAKPRAFRLGTRGVEGIETRMVGREMELKVLQDALYAAAEDGEGQIITILGEAGVGKSRLLYEFTNWIDLLPQEVRFFQGRARQDAQHQPYVLLRDMFSYRFSIQDGDMADEIQHKIETGFGEVFGRDESGQMRAHIFGQLLGYDFSASPHLKGVLEDAQQLRDRSLMYLDEYFQGMSEAGPTVIFLEDFHWADDSSLDVINQLSRKTPHRRMLIVCLARGTIYERRPHWGEGLDYHHRLSIKPLTKRDSRRLVDEILQRVDQVPVQLRDLVVKGAEGNPFYIEELIKMLLEDGVIVKDEARWRVELPRLADIDVPSTLTGVLQARLDSLPQGERALLQQASVVGRIFWDRVLQHMIAQEAGSIPGDGIAESLTSLRGRELIFHREGSTFAGSDEYIFKHALLRDVTYESILKRQRSVYHRLVAEWVIEQSDEYPGLIADHLEHAGDNDEAVKYLREAGDQAAGLYANAEAIAYFSRALDLTPESIHGKRYAMLLAREKIYSLRGERELQTNDMAALQELIQILGDDRKRAEVALRQAAYADATSNYPAAIAAAQEAIRLAQAVQDTGSQAVGHFQWGNAARCQGDDETARCQLEQALALSRAAGSRQVEADSLRSLGMLTVIQGDYDRAQTYYEEALRISREDGDRRGESITLFQLSRLFFKQGDNASMRDYAEQSLLIVRETGDRWIEVRLLNALGVDSHMQGDLQTTRIYYEKARRTSHEIGDREYESLVLGNLGVLSDWLGDLAAARCFLEQALLLTREIGSLEHESYVLNELGVTLALQGDYTAASERCEQSLRLARELGDRWCEVHAIGSLGVICDCVGNYSAARDHYETALQIARSISFRQGEVEVLANLGLLCHHLGEDQPAREYSQRALEIAQELGTEFEAYAVTHLGHALAGLGHLAEAADAYRKGLTLRRDMGQPHLATEPMAGLARVFLSQENPGEALALVAEILGHLESHTLEGTEEPIRIYLTCYRVLSANQDPRANEILADAYTLLQERAENIADESKRRSFLENVAVNREIVNEYEKL